MKPDCLVICGPTASGKTALAVALAQVLNGEVVSADSMQVYRGMDIGTAKPTKEEMQGVPHHMLDVADPRENYSVSRYVTDAIPVRRALVDAPMTLDQLWLRVNAHHTLRSRRLQQVPLMERNLRGLVEVLVDEGALRYVPEDGMLYLAPKEDV